MAAETEVISTVWSVMALLVSSRAAVVTTTVPVVTTMVFLETAWTDHWT